MTNKELNNSNVIKNINFDEMKISELVTFIKNNPSVLRRPIIVDDRRVQVGYNEEEIRTFIPRARRYADLLCGEWCPKFPTCPVGTDRMNINPKDKQCLVDEEKYFK